MTTAASWPRPCGPNHGNGSPLSPAGAPPGGCGPRAGRRPPWTSRHPAAPPAGGAVSSRGHALRTGHEVGHRPLRSEPGAQRVDEALPEPEDPELAVAGGRPADCGSGSPSLDQVARSGDGAGTAVSPRRTPSAPQAPSTATAEAWRRRPHRVAEPGGVAGQVLGEAGDQVPGAGGQGEEWRHEPERRGGDRSREPSLGDQPRPQPEHDDDAGMKRTSRRREGDHKHRPPTMAIAASPPAETRRGRAAANGGRSPTTRGAAGRCPRRGRRRAGREWRRGDAGPPATTERAAGPRSPRNRAARPAAGPVLPGDRLSLSARPPATSQRTTMATSALGASATTALSRAMRMAWRDRASDAAGTAGRTPRRGCPASPRRGPDRASGGAISSR